MPRTRKDEAPIEVDLPVVEGRYVELDDWTVAFETFPNGSDPALLFRGLPDDRCQCPHWGYVIRGELRVNYADRSETLHAGDAYYLRPGHLTVPADGTEIVEFSPTVEFQNTMAVVGANLQAGVGSDVTATEPITDPQAAPPVVGKLLDWLETTHIPDGLFTADVFLDFTPPQWRLQARGVEAAAAIRRNGHPAPGRVTRLRYDPTPSGFVFEWEEEWNENGEHWYCREMMRAEVRDGAISAMSVYCTGDWSSAHRERHAREVELIRA